METKDKLKSIGAALSVFTALVLLLCVFATIDSSALEVPRYDSATNELRGKGALTSTDANTLVNYVIALDRLGYLDTRNFLILARPSGGSTTRLYTSSTSGGAPVLSGSSITISNFNTVEFYGGIRHYGAVQASSISFPIENVLCYKVGESIVNNVSNGTYTTGAGRLSKSFSDYLIQFTNYVNTIIEWNGEDYQSGYEAGYSAGQQNGYGTGYNTGYAQGKSDGYNEGYEAGFADGEAEGGGGYTEDDVNDARQEGYDLGKAEGYDIGYLDGTDYGYEQGYNQAVRDATPNEVDVQGLVVSVAAAAREILDTSLGFEIFGFNVAATIVSVIIVLIVAFVVKKVLFK